MPCPIPIEECHWLKNTSTEIKGIADIHIPRDGFLFIDAQTGVVRPRNAMVENPSKKKGFGKDVREMLNTEFERLADVDLDLPPKAPSFITRVCGFGFHIPRFHFGQARRARSLQIAQALYALAGVFCSPAKSAA